MTDIGDLKAKRFATEADGYKWSSTITHPHGDEVHVVVVRGDERIHIWWRRGCLIETPKYTLAGRTISLHNAAGATRQLGLKPDLSKAYRRPGAKVAHEVTEDGSLQPIRHPLPFDLYEASDKEILRALRGNRVTWLNGMTGLAETSMLPKMSNMNLEDTFYLAENGKGRAYVSFMNEMGHFRAVYLDAILQVS